MSGDPYRDDVNAITGQTFAQGSFYSATALADDYVLAYGALVDHSGTVKNFSAIPLSGTVTSDSFLAHWGTFYIDGTQYIIHGASADGTKLVFNQDSLSVTNLIVLSTDGSVPTGAIDYATGYSLNPACYCPGTLILTPAGDKPIEQLEIGDLVVTGSGAHRPIRWIGRRDYAAAFARSNPALAPVRIKAGALDGTLPHRDLRISPAHAMLLDGVLIPAEALVNGHSIVRDDGGQQISYLHLELESHDIILAEGAPSETYLDCGNRALFQNAHEAEPRHAEAQHAPFARRVEHGPIVDTARRAIARLAGSPPRSGPLRGYVDQIGDGLVRGWAQDTNRPDVPVCLDILVDGVRAGTVLADRFRGDLRQAGLGSGRHAFCAAVPTSAQKSAVEVRRSSDQARLALSGEMLRPASAAA